MKRFACVATLCLASSLPAIADAAKDDLTSSLRGIYSFAGDGGCISSRIGISLTDFHTIPPGWSSSQSVEGVRRFNGDGTGTILSGRTVAVNHGGTSFSPAGIQQVGPATFSTFTADFTYTVAPDHTIHMEVGPLTQIQVVGPNPGGIAVTAGIRAEGHVSKDFKTITTATPNPDPRNLGPSVELTHAGSANGEIIQYSICHRSRVMVRIGDLPGRGKDDDSSSTRLPF